MVECFVATTATEFTKGNQDSAPLDSDVKDYIALLKPRVMSLVVFTGLCGLLMAPGHLHLFLALITICCIALGSGAAGAINMWYDRDIDQLMTRTMKRPIPSGRVPASEALGFGVIMSLASVVILGLATNIVAALLLATAIGYYVLIYTCWLKRRTPQNIVIGGAAGAFPPMIGWAAVTGSVSWESILLFAIIFMWTPPHFWALSLVKCDDYKKANVPMLPVTAGMEVTKKHILIYSWLLVPLTLVPVLINMATPAYGVVALLLGVRFLQLAHRIYKNYSDAVAKKLFFFSISYLFFIFTALTLDGALHKLITSAGNIYG